VGGGPHAHFWVREKLVRKKKSTTTEPRKTHFGWDAKSLGGEKAKDEAATPTKNSKNYWARKRSGKRKLFAQDVGVRGGDNEVSKKRTRVARTGSLERWGGKSGKRCWTTRRTQ